MLHDHGISVWGSFVFGFDTDDPEVFERTVEFAIDMRLTMASFAGADPYPGTHLYRRLLARAGSSTRSGGSATTRAAGIRTTCRSA
jgi:hypothetical protein